MQGGADVSSSFSLQLLVLPVWFLAVMLFSCLRVGRCACLQSSPEKSYAICLSLRPSLWGPSISWRVCNGDSPAVTAASADHKLVITGEANVGHMCRVTEVPLVFGL